MSPPSSHSAPELLWVLSAFSLVALIVSFAFGPGELPLLAVCSFKSSTGLPCPGCGLSHAFTAISHGQFGTAWMANPFGFVLYFGAVAMVVRPLLVRVAPWTARLFELRVILASLAVIGGAMLAFGVWRIQSGLTG